MRSISRIIFEKLLFFLFLADFREITQCFCLPRSMRTFCLTENPFGVIFGRFLQCRVHSGFLGAGNTVSPPHTDCQSAADRSTGGKNAPHQTSKPVQRRFRRVHLEFGDGAAPCSDHSATDELLFPNGPSGHHLSKYQAYNYRFHIGRIVEGWNEIVVYNEGSASDRIVSVEFAIKRT